MNTTINFEELKSEIEIATRIAFKENVEKYGTDIYAFSLISDDGAMTVVPYTNIKSHLEKEQLEDPEYKDSYEFEPAEWFTSDGANTNFHKICGTLCKEVGNDDLDFELFKNTLFKTCVQVLEKLRAEKFFKKELGKDLLIMFSISDNYEPKENLIKWMKPINNEKLAKRFEIYMDENY